MDGGVVDYDVDVVCWEEGEGLVYYRGETGGVAEVGLDCEAGRGGGEVVGEGGDFFYQVVGGGGGGWGGVDYYYLFIYNIKDWRSRLRVHIVCNMGVWNTFAPVFANASAISAPSPLEPPVTIASLPSSGSGVDSDAILLSDQTVISFNLLSL